MSVKDEKRMATAEMRMVRWAMGVSLLEHRRNEEILEEARMEAIATVMRRRRLELFGHVKSRGETENIRAVAEMKKAWNIKEEWATDLLESEGRIQTANGTRWSWQVKMIRSVLAIPAALLDQLDAPTITAYDRNIMNDMLEILEPFKEATDVEQRDKTVTASYIIPTIIGLPIHLATMESPITVV